MAHAALGASTSPAATCRPGEHRISINGRLIEQPSRSMASTPWSLRIYHNSVLTGQVATIGQLARRHAPVPAKPAVGKPPNRKSRCVHAVRPVPCARPPLLRPSKALD